MPRRRPGQVRAALPHRRRLDDLLTPAIPGLSPRLCAEIGRLKDPDDRLWPDTVLDALRLWQGFVCHPYRRLWAEDECGHWECCPDPWQAREILDEALHSLPRRAQAEFRRFVAAIDELY